VASFRSTLEETEDADVLVHVVDASLGEWAERVAVVNQTLEEVGLAEREVVMALNKADLLDEPTRERRAREAEEMGFRAVAVSATTGEGVAELAQLVSRGSTPRQGRGPATLAE
jgi:GTP-binding protein HflX